MAAQTALVLNTKSYAPRGKNQGDIGSWSLVGDTTFGGAKSDASLSIRESTKDAKTRVQFKLTLPKAATADSACACVGSELARGYADIVIHVPVQFTAAERDDFCKRLQGLVASAVFSSAVKDLEPVW